MIKCFFSFLMMIASQNVFSQSNDADRLRKLNYDWIHSYVTKDSVTFSRIFADDFILISPIGTKFTKKQTIANLLKQEITSARVDTIDVRLITGDVGIITAYITFVSKADGKDITGRTCYQDIYIKRKGKWLAVSAHVTSLGSK
ncbi:MAG TPA: nuclear transport factor 2 family protein [Puia sp.]|nr:nuclear transport factor 2 family protein [Puia sp.]